MERGDERGQGRLSQTERDGGAHNEHSVICKPWLEAFGTQVFGSKAF